ncbi:unnamed protein product [Pleuronectes platessa]|uniref:Uncharacterized protein n=1 Tax=Pleuronectes platessa TaxID=8262 RepID=A0A9N7VX11_PLEPL|nr:unnamed protein product [Pleuronectes platessa]
MTYRWTSESLFARSRDKAARRNERATLDKEEQQSAGGGDGGVEGKGEGERDVDEHEQRLSAAECRGEEQIEGTQVELALRDDTDRQENQRAEENELVEAGEMQREKEGQQETDRPERSHPRYETEKTVATVAENIRLGAREKSSVHNVEGHTSDLGGKESGPNQVKLSKYPQHNFGAKNRSFNN